MCTEPTDARRLLIVPVVIDILGEDAPRVLARRPGLVLVLVNVVPGPKSGDARGDSPAKGSLTAAAVAEGESSDAAIELRRCLALAAAFGLPSSGWLESHFAFSTSNAGLSSSSAANLCARSAIISLAEARVLSS